MTRSDPLANPGDNASPVVALRRDLHAFPELGFLEYRTAALVAERLERHGYGVRVGPEVMDAAAMMGAPDAAAIAAAQAAALKAGASATWVERMPDGMTGVVADMRRGEGPVLVLRFDIDALPIRETEAPGHRPNLDGYRSERPGVMHACGHDGHTAIGLVLAQRLADPAARWRGTLRLVFQPAEEGGRGAWPMVSAGVVDDADFFFCGHLGCLLPSGTIAAEATGFLYSTKIDATFSGIAAHAAMGPQEGRNALLAGATATLGLYAISRHGGAATLVNVGTLHAGSGRNVIADHCKLELEVRGESEAALAYIEGRAHEVLAGAALAQGVTLKTAVMGRSAGIVQSPTAVAIVAEAAARTPGTRAVVPGWPIGGGDDATFMMARVQERGGIAAYCLIGCDLPAVHHAVDFDLDEDALDHGLTLFETIALTVLAPRSPEDHP